MDSFSLQMNFQICKFQNTMLKHVNSEIAILGSPYFLLCQITFRFKKISVASGYSGDFFM